MHHPTDRIASAANIAEQWLEREKAQWICHEGIVTDHLDKEETCYCPFELGLLCVVVVGFFLWVFFFFGGVGGGVQLAKEGNILFNNILNTFYLRYMKSVMVNYHSDSKRRNLLPPHGLLFPISSKGSFICIIPQTG